MKRVIVVLSALFLLISGTANAEPAGRGHMGREMMDYGPGHYDTGLSANPTLNLTVEQSVRLRSLDDKYALEMKSIQGELYHKGSALKSEWLQARPDRGKITALQCEVSKLRDQMQEKMTSHRRDVLNILTPEQQAHIEKYGPARGERKLNIYGK